MTETEPRAAANSRSRDLMAMILVGDGLLGLLIPGRHVHRWNRGPATWRCAMQYLELRPGLTRLLAASELCVGLWLGLQDG
jgi:hypothetical protein